MGKTLSSNESIPSNRKKIIVLGSGPNRIGQGIEFDYSCVHGVLAAKECGYETIMINCNPETVSTDYDTSDELFFEPLVSEHVIEIMKYVNPKMPEGGFDFILIDRKALNILNQCCNPIFPCLELMYGNLINELILSDVKIQVYLNHSSS